MPAQTRNDRAGQAARDRQSAESAELATRDGNGNGEVEAGPRDEWRILLTRFKPEVAAALPKTGVVDVEAFIRQALTGMKASKQAVKLQQCDRPSLLSALLEAARLGLMPFTDEAAIVPYGKVATFIPMYQGYEQLFYRTGQIARVVRGLIYARDEWALAYGDGGGFYHKPLLVDPETGERPDRGNAILAYCYLVYRDGNRTEVTTVTRWEAEEIRDEYSRAYQWAEKKRVETNGRQGGDSPWHTDFDKQWEKTAIRKHAKDAPKSPELVALLMYDRRDDTREDVRAAAPPPPVPMTDVTGPDWTHDVNGAVPGEVIRDGPEPPSGVVVAGTVIPPGDPDPGGWPEGGAEPRQQEQAEPPPGGTEGEDDPTEKRRLLGQLGQRFKELGWTGDDYAAARLSLAGILAVGQAKVPPLDLAAPGKLTVRQVKIALATWDARAKAAEEAGENLADVFQGLYEARAALEAEADAAPAATTPEEAGQ